MKSPYVRYKRHNDDEFCDEIRIKVIPRFKTSGLSGDEWRVSTRVQFLRKGLIYAERAFSKMDSALLMLGGFYIQAHEPVPKEALEREKVMCDQPGCDAVAVNHYRKKAEHHGHSGVVVPVKDGEEVRCKFCARHSVRGNSDLEDNDENLVLVKGDGKADPSMLRRSAWW